MMELSERLRSHLTQLVRERDPYLAREGHFYVQHYIRNQLGQWGTVTSHEFVIQGRTHHNWILDLPAQMGRSETPSILLGAHYDAVPGTPGADDNASGVAVLLELARAIATSPVHYPIRLVAFDMEEYGLLGSTQYAVDLRQQKQPLRLMISLEMLGYCDPAPNSQRYPAGLQYFYPNRGNFIGLIGNLPTLPDLIHLSHFIRNVGVPVQWLPAGMRGQLVPTTRLSDHAPFWDQGYRAVMITDTAFMRNPNYHQRSDRMETLDLNFMSGICQGLIDGITHIR